MTWFVVILPLLFLGRALPATVEGSTFRINSGNKALPKTDDLNYLVQSCVSQQISSQGCDQQNWGCFCDNSTWLAGISKCVAFQPLAPSPRIDPDDLSSIYCQYQSNLYTEVVTLTYKNPAPAIYRTTTIVTPTTTTNATTATSFSSSLSIADALATDTSSTANTTTATIVSISPTLFLNQGHHPEKASSRNLVRGLAIGIPLGFIFVASFVCMACIIIMRRRAKSKTKEKKLEPDAVDFAPGNINNEGTLNSPMTSADCPALHEIDSVEAGRSELRANWDRPELEA